MVNNMEEFEKYFKTADLDRNGRISISEAISFFRKFGLPNTDLVAKIWKYVDQEERGFLERTEFYNALKLVTLAQKGFSINPETVISQLYGPNSPQIPAPIIPSSQVEIGPKFEEDVNTESHWPRISEKDIQIYTHIFEKIDKDNAGLICSEQARTCFISWKLPIEVINQVIDLSDLDKDGIFSLRELCIAIYLLARYKDGISVPDFLPNSVLFDENLIRATGLPSSSYFSLRLESNSGSPESDHEPSATFPFQKQYVNSPTLSPKNGSFDQNLINHSQSTSSNREWSLPKEPQQTYSFSPRLESNLIRATGLPSSSYFSPRLESNSGSPESDHESSATFPFQKQYVNSPTISPTNESFNQNLINPSPKAGTSSNREWSIPKEPQQTYSFTPNYNYQPTPSPYKNLDYDSNTNHNYKLRSQEILNCSGPIHYPMVPTAPIEPLFTTHIRYPSVELTHVNSVQSQTLISNTEHNKEIDGTNISTEDKGENRECVVCCVSEKNCACLPCGHVATCYMCLEMIKKSGGLCPICRGEIKQVLKIYTA